MAKDDKHDETSSSATVREQGNVSLQCPKLSETNYTACALMMETILKAYGIWETIVANEGVATNEKNENTSKAIIFQTLPQDMLMQVAQYTTAKEVGDTACCGSGPFRLIFSCGGKRGIMEYELCDDVTEFFLCDSSHPTELAYRQFAEMFWKGDYMVTAPYNLQAFFKNN
nr:SGNH hydrolase-type esterase domain-containing protein [Tanacetum cinerariifolium]